jgi:hypothetical protein
MTTKLDDATLAYGARAMTALLGLDRLYRKASGDQDGLAVVNLDHTGMYPPDALSTYDEARACFEDLARDAAALPEADRRAYYQEMCRASLSFIAWQNGGLTFEQQLTGFLGVPAAPASDEELEAMRAELRTLLGRMGFSGDLRAQCAAWEERTRVAAADVPAVLQGFLDEAWERTERLVAKIPAPRSDGMRVKPVRGVPFNARCDYLARTVELNVEPVLTRPGLKHLAVHECTPGHYLQFKMREAWVKDGTAAADALLSVVNTASSSVFEGIGDAGLVALDWFEGDDDRVQAIINRYRAGIGTGAAFRLHALGWDAARVEEWLTGESLTGGEGWVKNRMGFISAPARAVLIWSYWWGEPVVVAAWERATKAGRREELFRYLYGRMHSTTSLGMFA